MVLIQDSNESCNLEFLEGCCCTRSPSCPYCFLRELSTVSYLQLHRVGSGKGSASPQQAPSGGRCLRAAPPADLRVAASAASRSGILHSAAAGLACACRAATVAGAAQGMQGAERASAEPLEGNAKYEKVRDINRCA